MTLEWTSSVDPFGSALPKLGVFIVGEPEAVDAGRQSLVSACEADDRVQWAGYRVTSNKVWPVMATIEKSRDWWHGPDAWAEQLVEAFVRLWSLTAPLLDESYPDRPT